MSVVEHSAIGDAFMRISEMLQVLIVGGDDSESAMLAELFQHSLGYGSTNSRLGACAELVNEKQ